MLISVKSRILNKAVYSILYIDTFEQKCVVIKYMLKSSRLEYHTKTIGIDQSSFTRYSFEHIYMNNIKKIYQHAGKCDYQQSLKDIIDAAILSTPEEVTDNSVFSPTYWMLNQKQQNFVLWLQNQNAKP